MTKSITRTVERRALRSKLTGKAAEVGHSYPPAKPGPAVRTARAARERAAFPLLAARLVQS
jgi:hypothetical protein